MSGLGYNDVSAAPVHGVVDVADIQHAELWSRRGDDLGPLLIDLHWRLPGWEAPPETSWAALRSSATTIDLGARQVAVLGRGALALHLATHLAQHGPEDRKALADLERGADRWPLPVWEDALRLAAVVDAIPALAAGLRLTPAGAALADRLELPQAAALTRSILARDDRPRGTFHLDAFAAARSPRERLRVLRHALLPTRRWIERRYRWSEHGAPLVALGYIAHIATAPLWAARAWRHRRRLSLYR